METFRPWPARISLRRRRGQGISALRAGAWRNELIEHLRVLSICVRCHWMLPAWGQRASGPHAIGRVAREGLRSPPGAPGKKSKGSKAEAMQKANQKKQSCYPRARVSHVIPGRACHMLPCFALLGFALLGFNFARLCFAFPLLRFALLC